MRVDIRLLGAFEVVVDGRPVSARSWHRRSSAALVKLLALQPGGRLRREQVIDALWPDLLLDDAAPRLHTAAHYARSALNSREAVVLGGDTVALFPDAELSVDVAAFDRAADRALADPGPDTAAEAVALYAGDLLPDDAYEPWADDARTRRRLRYLALLRDLGRWEEVLAAEPLDAEAHLAVVGDHLRHGRRGPALRALDAMDDVLRREIGVEPGREARALRQQALALPVVGADAERRAAPRGTPVPLPPTPTIGREDDVARIGHLLDRSAIVTLLGPGGVGKTRLAVEVALNRSRSRGTEACFVDLTKVGVPDLVPELIARELGVHAGSAESSERTLTEALRRRSLLLVLDNFEHVVEAASMVSRLVRGAPGLRVLCTSRARLHLTGEQIYDVAPLEFRADGAGVPPAVRLFEQAATAVDHDFRLAPSLGEVAAICRHVDGLPLAIELAAGHVRTLPPALLLTRLDVRLGSPTGAARDAPSRQQTIPATIDWSLQLLGSPEQRLFARLGIFAGAVPLEAIERVCADDADGAPDVVDALSRLVDQSLVRRGTDRWGVPRFRLLELLRERARTLLPEEERAGLRERHAGWVAEVLEDLDERRWGDVVPWIDRMTDLLPEIHAAHSSAQLLGDRVTAARITAALGTYWHREGHHAEGRRWVTEALADGSDLDDLLVTRLRIAAGLVTWTVDELTAREHWTIAADLARRIGADRYLAYALAFVAVTYVGDDTAYEAALWLSDEAIALARTVGEAPLIAQALNIQGELARVHGDDSRALRLYEEGLDLATRAGDGVHLAMLLSNLGYLADHRGDFRDARRLHRAGLELCWSLGHRMVAAWTLAELAGPELGLGRPGRAARLIGAGDQALHTLGVARAPGDRPEHDRVVRALRAELGNAAFERFCADGAQLSLDEAVELALREPDPAP